MIRPYIQVSNKLTARTQRLIRSYRGIMMDALTDYLDTVRERSQSEIIPSKDPSNRYGFTRMYKNQPSTPGKLTERTGALLKMLRDKSSWSKKARSRSMSGDAMQGNVALTTTGTIIAEQFYGTLSANIKADTKYWPRGSRTSWGPTKQQLYFRFQWESGIRGGKRPFLAPAAEKTKFNTESIIQAKLDRLEMIGVIKYI